MTKYRIEMEGFTLGEARSLAEVLKGVDEVVDAHLWPFPPGTVQYRSPVFSPQANLHHSLHLVLQIGKVAGDLAGSTLEVERLWEKVAAYRRERARERTHVRLYGPDDRLIGEEGRVE